MDVFGKVADGEINWICLLSTECCELSFVRGDDDWDDSDMFLPCLGLYLFLQHNVT